MKRLLPAAILALTLAASTAAAFDKPLCYELRGPASAYSTLSHIEPSIFQRHDTPLARVVSSLDLPTFTFDDRDRGPFVFSNTPATAAALDSALAENGWNLRDFPIPEEWPSSTRLYVQDADTATNHPILLIPHDRHILLTDTPVVDRIPDFLDSLSSLPASIPAEGTFAVYFTNLATRAHYHNDPIEAFLSFFSTLAIGVGSDDDTLALHIVLAPPPGSPLADWLRAIPPVPPSTACLNLPDALATFALAPLPPFPADLLEKMESPNAHRLSGHAFAAALFPPPDLPREVFATLFYASAADPVAPFRTLDAWFGGLSTNRIHGNTVIYIPATLPTNAVSPRPHTGDFLRDMLTQIMPLIVPLPSGILAAGHVPSATVDAAIDAALDGGSTRPFDQSPSFRAAFPAPDAPPIAILHADLRAIRNSYQISRGLLSFDTIKDENGPPFPLDAYAYVTPDASLVLRIRLPVLRSPAPGGIAGSTAPSEGAASSRVEGPGTKGTGY